MKAKAKDSARAKSKKETAAKKVTKKITPKTKITPKKKILRKKRKESKEDMKKYERGAASFYVVAISTLILVIIAASFAALIVSEVSRTSNDDLAQSAYDAALAGVEDAKLAFMNYQECKALPESQRASKIFGSKGDMNCEKLVEQIETQKNSESSCDMVADALGRSVVNKEGEEITDLEGTPDDEKMGVLVQEGTGNDGNAMNQYYTCTTISTQTDDYLGVLTMEDFERSAQIKFADELGPDGEVVTDKPYEKVNRIRLSWHSFGDNAESGDAGKWFTWMTPNGTSTLGTTEVTPAMMTMTMVQTGPTFNLDSFNVSQGNQTNRGTLYFVPTKEDSVADGETYISLTDPNNSETGNRVLEADALVQSNSKDQVNKPYIVHCDTTGTQDYACMVDIDIPQPIGGERNPDTFVVSMTASYGAPKTDYRLEFFVVENDVPMPLTLDDVQISIDSTGRANDLFRRVDTRLEATDTSYPYPFFGLETLQTKSISRFETEEDQEGADAGIHKNFTTVCEYNFDDLTCH